ncbi:MAG: hypothetical protein KDA33_17695, partial [Phycisphaerales bacterium]|nr:hypothetical protein [Phycisphaerales bacterium]
PVDVNVATPRDAGWVRPARATCGLIPRLLGFETEVRIDVSRFRARAMAYLYSAARPMPRWESGEPD